MGLESKPGDHPDPGAPQADKMQNETALIEQERIFEWMECQQRNETPKGTRTTD